MPTSKVLAEYTRSQIVKDRNLIALLKWANSITGAPYPPNPDRKWVRLLLLAERIPQQTETYVLRTIAYFLQDPYTQVDAPFLLNPWNEPDTEKSLDDQVGTVIARFIQRFADVDITSPQVTQWYLDNGIAEPT